MSTRPTPTAHATRPTLHPITNLVLIRSAKSEAMTAGMTRNEKTSRTPAMATDEVITKANVT